MPRHGQYPDVLEDNVSRTLQEQPDRGPATNAGTSAGGMQPRAGLPIQLPGFNDPPDGNYPIDERGAANLAGGAVELAVVTVVVPRNTHFRGAWIGFGADNEAALATLSWRLFDAGRPAIAYGEPSSAIIGTVVHPTTITLHAQGPTRLTVEITNTAPGGSPVLRFVVRLGGWLYQNPTGG